MTSTTPAQTGYAPVNGLNLYYEIYGGGAGKPLVALHGGLGMTSMYAALLPGLSQTRQVIAVELQGHGHTADVDRPFSFETMGDDIAALIKNLGFDSADLVGCSLGGGVAFQTAIRHPEVINKLIIISAPCKRDGWYPEVLTGMAAMTSEFAPMMVGSPPHAEYVSAAPRPDDWPVMVGKTGDLLRKDYDWSADVAKITAPSMLIFGDADAVRLDHIVEMYRLLGGRPAILSSDGTMEEMPRSQLAVLPGTAHYDIFSKADLLLPIIPRFLDAPVSGSAGRS